MDALRAFYIRPGDYVLAGQVVIAKNLVLWFVYCLVVALCAGPTAFIGFALALWQQTIWYNRSWVTTLKSTIDGLVYALVTAGVFAWLWPA